MRPKGRSTRREAWLAQLAEAFAHRKCSHRGCRWPVISIAPGQAPIREAGILVVRGKPDRCYCIRHVPGLLREAVPCATTSKPRAV